MRKLLITFLLGGLTIFPVWAADKPPVQVTVADPFIELHSGPNINFPVYDVVERGELINILRRRTDWFEIRASKNREGWVRKDQLEATLAAAGIQPTLRDKLVDNYLDSRFRFDAAGGVFEGEGIVTIRGGYRATNNVTVEMSFSNISGVFADSVLFQTNVMIELHVLNSLRPYGFMGVGYFTNVPDNLSSGDPLVSPEKDDLPTAQFGVGVQYFFTKSFLLRAEIEQLSTLQGNKPSDKFLSGTLGVGFFF